MKKYSFILMAILLLIACSKGIFTPTDMEEERELYENGDMPYLLEQVEPNPFSDEARIRLQARPIGHIEITLWEGYGDRLKTLFDGSLSGGTYVFSFYAKDYDNGQYWIIGDCWGTRQIREFEVRK